MDLLVPTVDGEPLERDRARLLSKRDKWLWWFALHSHE
jgi:hypothetical protein